MNCLMTFPTHDQYFASSCCHVFDPCWFCTSSWLFQISKLTDISPKVSQKLARLTAIVAERVVWENQLAQGKRMRQWILDAEDILDGSWVQAREVVTNETMGIRLDTWRQTLATHLSDGTLSELEHECLTQVLQILSNLHPHQVQCYDRKDFPRNNNEMERSIRHLKTRYRRISGRKNWNSYLLCYGRSVAHYDWWE